MAANSLQSLVHSSRSDDVAMRSLCFGSEEFRAPLNVAFVQ